MYTTDNGIEIYETLQDLLSKDILKVGEYDEKYYVELKTDDPYDNTVWIVDKNTLEVSWIHFTTFIIEDIDEKVKPVDIETLRRLL